MRNRAYILAIVLALISTAHATQWPAKSLAELLTEADIVVVGSINTETGRTTSEYQDASVAYTWNSSLAVSAVLKGEIDGNEVSIKWDEIRIGGRPDYEPKEERIWLLNILMTDGRAKTYWTSGRPDTVMNLYMLEEVKTILKNSIEQSVPGYPPQGVGSPEP